MIRYLKEHPQVLRGLILGYVVFAGCFAFPISSAPFPLDFSKARTLIVCYGVIGLGFAGVYGTDAEKRVYLQTLVFTVLGLVCRYFLEFGEVSNTYNFTLFNVILYLALIPLWTLLSYALLSRKVLRKQEETE